MVVANNAYAHPPKVYPYPNPRALPHVNPKARKRALARRRARRVVAGVLVVILALAVVYRYGQINEMNMQINEKTKTRDSLLDEQRRLKITISELSSLGRIERVAIEELGMRYPGPSQIRYVGSNNTESRDGDGG